MKLSLSSDYSTPEHWRRVVEFAKQYDVDRLVFWGDSCTGRNKFSGFTPPFLYPEYPKLNCKIKDGYKEAIYKIRDYFKYAYQLTVDNGMEFWYTFQVLQFPDVGFNSANALKNVDFGPIKEIFPDLINQAGEIDMSQDFIYEFITNQVNELFELAPELTGIELWVMERSTVKIARLKHQKISTDEILSKIVKTVRDNLKSRNCQLDIDLHTAGGETKTLFSLLDAARKYQDVIVSADNTIGDYHLHLPFNQHLERASRTNRVIVNFDLNGEYWGKNFVPTTAINQYEKHIEEARKINAKYINGRVATENDLSNPHVNVLPARKKSYPGLEQISNSSVLDACFRIPCLDTLTAFNAIYFCLKAKNSATMKEKVIEDFLNRELEIKANSKNEKLLTNIFLNLENTLKKIFYVDKNLYHGQSLLCKPAFVPVYAIDEHITSPAGTLFPTAAALAETNESVHPVAFKGWPVPENHICCGPAGIITEKEEAVSETGAFLKDVREVATEMSAVNGTYLVRMFEDLHFFARAFGCLAHGHIHYFLLQKGRQIDEFPNVAILEIVLANMKKLADEWTERYLGGRYSMTETLTEWHSVMTAYMVEAQRSTIPAKYF